MGKSLYDLLQVSQRADQDVIDAAYERLEARYSGTTDEPGRIAMKAIREAYDTLRNPARRAAYDRRIAPSEPARYESDAANALADWWRGPRMLGILVGVTLLIGTGVALNYALGTKTVKVQATAVKVEEKRADTEADASGRLMDNLDRAVDLAKESLDNQQEIARAHAQQSSESTQSFIKTQQERTEIQRQDAEIRKRQSQLTEAERLNAEQRQQQEYADLTTRRQLERDREELCRLEAIRYNRPYSCPETTTSTTTTTTGTTSTGDRTITTTRSTNRR